MLKIKLFTVYDSKAESYDPPFFAKTTAEGMRSFEIGCNSPQTAMYQAPEDFTFFEIGEFELATGEIHPYKNLKNLGMATNFKKQQNLFAGQQVMDFAQAQIQKAAQQQVSSKTKKGK